MNTELIRILTDIKMLIEDWNARVIPTEQEFLDTLWKLKERLVLEMKDQKEPKVLKV